MSVIKAKKIEIEIQEQKHDDCACKWMVVLIAPRNFLDAGGFLEKGNLPFQTGRGPETIF